MEIEQEKVMKIFAMMRVLDKTKISSSELLYKIFMTTTEDIELIRTMEDVMKSLDRYTLYDDYFWEISDYMESIK